MHIFRFVRKLPFAAEMFFSFVFIIVYFAGSLFTTPPGSYVAYRDLMHLVNFGEVVLCDVLRFDCGLNNTERNKKKLYW